MDSEASVIHPIISPQFSNPPHLDKRLHVGVEQAIRELVTAEYRVDGAYVSTPLLYPSGASVVVRISQLAEDNFYVTDFGSGYVEAEMMGASVVYSRHANDVAQAAGVSFDHHAFFALKVSGQQLAGAVSTVANCSLEAVALAAYKLADRKIAEAGQQLYDRLVTIFEPRQVAKDASIYGASSTRWHVAALVTGNDNKPTIFEPVSKFHVSVVNAAAKFNDLARLDNPPNRVAVVRDKAQFGTYLGILSQAANVVELNVSDTVYRRLAA
jgi:hypothetical protein